MSLPTDAAGRKALPILTYLTEYFPDATLAEVEVAVAGNDQHNPGEPLHWARGKSPDQLDAAFRHLWDHKLGAPKDTDGQWHLAKAIWRLKAELQLLIEQEQKANDNRSKVGSDHRDLGDEGGQVDSPIVGVLTLKGWTEGKGGNRWEGSCPCHNGTYPHGSAGCKLGRDPGGSGGYSASGVVNGTGGQQG